MFNVYNQIEIVVKETQCDIIVREFQSVECHVRVLVVLFKSEIKEFKQIFKYSLTAKRIPLCVQLIYLFYPVYNLETSHNDLKTIHNQ